MDKIDIKVAGTGIGLTKKCILEQFEETVKSVEEKSKDGMIQYRCAQLAMFCCRGYFGNEACKGKWIIQSERNYDVVTALHEFTNNRQVVKNRINHFLRDIGLEITEVSRYSRCLVTFVIEEVDPLKPRVPTLEEADGALIIASNIDNKNY